MHVLSLLERISNHNPITVMLIYSFFFFLKKKGNTFFFPPWFCVIFSNSMFNRILIVLISQILVYWRRHASTKKEMSGVEYHISSEPVYVINSYYRQTEIPEFTMAIQTHKWSYSRHYTLCTKCESWCRGFRGHRVQTTWNLSMSR
jgi:hypothetical protein